MEGIYRGSDNWIQPVPVEVGSVSASLGKVALN
jgi:hypothetical protein